MQIAHQFQPAGEGIGLLETGQHNEVMYLAHPAVFLVNGADFSRDGGELSSRRRLCLPGPVSGDH